MRTPPGFGVVLATCLSCLAPAGARAAEEFTFFREHVLGTSMELRVRADDATAAARAEERALREIERLAALYSNHDPSSEFRRWQATRHAAVAVSPELFGMLRACDAWRDRSGGAFDPRIDGLSRLWAACARQYRLPTETEIAEARRAFDTPAWCLDEATGMAERRGDTPLTLDAIAKGEIVERACVAALDPADGARGVLLNLGGDLRVAGAEPRRIGIAPARGDSESAEPEAFLEVHDRSVATSGNAQRGFRIQGRWYSHILDPRSGRPVENTVAATVVAPRGADADALATTCNVLPVAEALRLVDSVPDAACRLVNREGRVHTSTRWAAYERPRPELAAAHAPLPAAAAAEADPEDWGKAFELAVDFVINRPADAGRGYRRPYVVVWVEDEKGVSVRTLLVWVSLGGSGPDRWLPDLTRWYRGDASHTGQDRKNEAYTIGRPTRAPGQYSVVWDGKDDEGKPLGPGKYTVSIEAAREHGTHQLMRKPVVIGTEPFAHTLPGNVEIESATITFRKKAAQP